MKKSVAERPQLAVLEAAIKTSPKCFISNIVTASFKSTAEISIQEASIVIKTLVLDDLFLKYDLIVGREFLGHEN